MNTIPFFGHQFLTKKVLVGLMDFLGKISIEKYGSAVVSGAQTYIPRKIIQVPVQWAARDKWIDIITSSSARKAMDPTIRDKNPVEMQWILPRIGVYLTGITYDSARRLTKIQTLAPDYIQPTIQNSKQRKNNYTPSSYNLEVDACVVTKYIDDQFQIMEQILPYFGPALSMDIKLFDDKGADSVPIILNNISPDIPIDIPESQERLFTFTYSFTLKMNYYIQRKDQGLIFRVDSNLIDGYEGWDVIQVTNEYLQELDKIETRFSEYDKSIETVLDAATADAVGIDKIGNARVK